MKVLFLDVDGVLNVMSDSYRTFMKPEGHHIEYHLVDRLNYIIAKTDAKVVISSSWKSDMDDLEFQLKQEGFRYWDRVIGRTPFSGEMRRVSSKQSGYRGFQIMQWLRDYPYVMDIEQYVVLEDEISDVCGEKCSEIPFENVVAVDMNEGLSHYDTMEAIMFLNTGKRRDIHKKEKYFKQYSNRIYQLIDEIKQIKELNEK